MPLNNNNPKNDKSTNGAVSVIDIGSNTVRLVIYDNNTENPAQIFTQREFCELGRNQKANNDLDPVARKYALDTVEKFIKISQEKSVQSIEAFATSAVRCAKDGQSFVEQINQSTGVLPVILSGEEEAELAACGVLAGFNDAKGVIADFGGGSLELARISNKKATSLWSLPFGTLSYGPQWKENPKAVNHELVSALSSCDGLAIGSDSTALYLVGGSFRALASAYLEKMDCSPDDVHGLRLSSEDAQLFFKSVSSKAKGFKKLTKNVVPRRLEHLPFAANVANVLIQQMAAKQVVFCAYGIREGLLYKRRSG